MNADVVTLRKTLAAIAPGTVLCERLERIQRSYTDALIVLGYTPETEALCLGGFDLDAAFAASRLRELRKMDGAVALDTDKWRIHKANIQLPPDPPTPTNESGMRHHMAQWIARQTCLPILSLPASMRMIPIYAGEYHRLVGEPEALPVHANLAVGTLDRCSQRPDEVPQTLTVFEICDSATVRNVTTVL